MCGIFFKSPFKLNHTKTVFGKILFGEITPHFIFTPSTGRSDSYQQPKQVY